MAIELRPWPGRDDDDAIGRDTGDDLVIHYAPDGAPRLWEIEHASRHHDLAEELWIAGLALELQALLELLLGDEVEAEEYGSEQAVFHREDAPGVEEVERS